MRILVSACLLGMACRYDGTEKIQKTIAELAREHQLIPICPELYGGLPTPRPPAERQGMRVVTQTGGDVTAQYRRGAKETLKLAQLLDCRCAVLKERSPSCGRGQIYDGTFTGTLTAGDGVAAALLVKHGVAVFGESQLAQLAAWLRRESDFPPASSAMR